MKALKVWWIRFSLEIICVHIFSLSQKSSIKHLSLFVPLVKTTWLPRLWSKIQHNSDINVIFFRINVDFTLRFPSVQLTFVVQGTFTRIHPTDIPPHAVSCQDNIASEIIKGTYNTCCVIFVVLRLLYNQLIVTRTTHKVGNSRWLDILTICFLGAVDKRNLIFTFISLWLNYRRDLYLS